MTDLLQPFALPESRPFWDAATEERLIIRHCEDCGAHYFPPSPICPQCTSRNVDWINACGRARLYSYSITHRPWPEWGTDGPMSVALVELEEGPRLISTVVNCEQTPESLMIDMPLRAVHRQFGETRVLCFEPDVDEETPV